MLGGGRSARARACVRVARSRSWPAITSPVACEAVAEPATPPTDRDAEQWPDLADCTIRTPRHPAMSLTRPASEVMTAFGMQVYAELSREAPSKLEFDVRRQDASKTLTLLIE
jgi:hypothetical protein